MDKLLNLVISGSVTGAIYSIMAAGLILTYTTSGMFNFAHGAVAFVTAFFYFELNTGQGIPIVPALVISVLSSHHSSTRPRLRAPAAPRQGTVYAQIVGTIGLLVALPALVVAGGDVGNTVLHLDLPSLRGDAGVSGPGSAPYPPRCSIRSPA